MRVLFAFLLIMYMIAPQNTAYERARKDMIGTILVGAVVIDIFWVGAVWFIRFLSLDSVNLNQVVSDFINGLPTWAHILFWVGLTLISIGTSATMSMNQIEGERIVMERAFQTKKSEDTTEQDNATDVTESEESISFENYQKELIEGIQHLSSQEKFIEDEAIRQDISQIKAILIKIKDNVDDTEYKHGNLARLTSYYLPTFVEIVKQYLDLKGLSDIVDMSDALNDVRHNIKVSKDIYTNMLKEAVAKDILDVTTTGKVYNQVAVNNGLLYDKNTLSMETLK